MPSRHSRWCGKCRAVHAGDEQCPHRVAFGRKRKFAKRSGRGGSKWGKLRKRIFERDLYLCQLCRHNGVVAAVELHGPLHGVCDHVVPIAEGGSDDESNLQTLCQSCDKVKTQSESIRGRGY